MMGPDSITFARAKLQSNRKSVIARDGFDAASWRSPAEIYKAARLIVVFCGATAKSQRLPRVKPSTKMDFPR